MKNLQITPGLIVFILTGTVCFILISFAVGIVVRPPEEVTDTGRTMMADAIKFILGMISGFIGAKVIEKKDDTTAST